MYKKLFKIFQSFDESKWQQLINDILDYKSLNLPVSINSGEAYEAFIFINDFLFNKGSKNIYLKYQNALIDHYTMLKICYDNIEKFETLHWVFSNFKIVEYRYALESKFTREEFINKLSGEVGENLQINLLSCLSNFSYIEKQSLITYLFARMDKYKTKEFILISLRYIFKTNKLHSYKEFLNKLIKKKLDKVNAPVFIEAFKEYVFLKKEYKQLYYWYTEFELNLTEADLLEKEQFDILKTELRIWINYKNIDIDNKPYCEMLFFELNKEKIIPCVTLRNLSNYFERIPLFKEKINEYFKYAYYEFYKLTPFQSPLILYRFPLYAQTVAIDKEWIPNKTIKYLVSIYKLLQTKDLFNAKLTLVQEERLKSLIPIRTQQYRKVG